MKSYISSKQIIDTAAGVLKHYAAALSVEHKIDMDRALIMARDQFVQRMNSEGWSFFSVQLLDEIRDTVQSLDIKGDVKKHYNDMLTIIKERLNDKL